MVPNDPLDSDAVAWEERLDQVVQSVSELSHIFDPQAMVERYADRMQEFMPVRRLITLSRRGFGRPRYGIALVRSWDEKAELRRDPSHFEEIDGGLLGELLYAGAPRIVHELEVADDDPACEYLRGQRSLIAIPVFEQGEVVEMLIQTRDRPHGFDPDRFPEMVWLTNVFTRATFYARRMEELRRAHAKLDDDLAYIAGLQRALLPKSLPEIPGLRLALRYQPFERSGGDYYDFFALPEGRWGILLADISGHGTPTAVLMAITHAIAHLYARPAARPSSLLRFLNKNLVARYTAGTNSFVTAFHGIYEPARRRLSYALAGHPGPRLLRAGDVTALEEARGPPLGVSETLRYMDATVALRPADQVVIFTDGVTEARNAAKECFGETRLDRALARPCPDPDALADAVSSAAAEFVGETESDDDRTVLTLQFD